jgi:general L-amino acid transport system permease protein
VKLVERTSVTGGGFSVLGLFGGVSGKWETLKKGDARMRRDYGVASWLNLVVLLYALTFAMMLYYLFVEKRAPSDSYYLWSMSHKLITLLLTVFSGAAMVTCIFKHYRFIDMAAVELVFFILAVLIGLPFGDMTVGVPNSVIVFGGLAARLAVIGYTVFGSRPNVTFFYRVREGAES